MTAVVRGIEERINGNGVYQVGMSCLFRRVTATRVKAALFLLSISVLSACDVEFEAQITPLVLYTPDATEAFGAVVTEGTLTELEISGTANAELTPVPTQTPVPSANTRGDPSEASYEEVWCGDVEKICYKLCFLDECGVYDVTSPRVSQFVDAVDMREDEILKWESEGRAEQRSSVAAFVSCGGTLLSSIPIYGIITAVDPEPISKTILVGGGAVVALVACGGSLLSLDHASTEQGIHNSEIDKQTLIAEQSFGYLQDFGKEVDLDE